MRCTRTLAAAAAAAVASAVTVSGTAAASPEQDFSVKVSGTDSRITAGSTKRPRTVSLRISTGTVQTTPGVVPPTTSEARIYFPRGARFNGRHFASCTATKIRSRKSTDDCPSRAKVGSGDAIGLAPGGITQDDIDIEAFNGPKGRYVNLFVEGASPLRLQNDIVAKVARLKSRTYSYRLTVPIPENLQEPAPGVNVAISRFTVRIPKKTTRHDGERIGYLESIGCPSNRRLKFKGVFEYANGERTVTTDTIRCRPRR